MDQFQEIAEWIENDPKRVSALQKRIWDDTASLRWKLIKLIATILDLSIIFFAGVFVYRYFGGSFPAQLEKPVLARSVPSNVNADAWAIIVDASSKEPGCDPALVYAVWTTETNDVDCSAAGSDCLSYAGAEGPLQFMPGTFAKYKAAHPEWDVYSLADSSRAACQEMSRLGLFDQKDKQSFQNRFSGQDGGQVWNGGSDGYAQAGTVWDRSKTIEAKPKEVDPELSQQAAEVWDTAVAITNDIEKIIEEKIGKRVEATDVDLSPVTKDHSSIRWPYDSYTLTQGIHGQSYGHMAVDLSAGAGAEILSPINGVVTQKFLDGYGNPTLVIENEKYQVMLLHGNYSVSQGDSVRIGQVVGTEGNNGYTMNRNGFCGTGSNCGYHTHLNIYDKEIKSNVSPFDVLK